MCVCVCVCACVRACVRLRACVCVSAFVIVRAALTYDRTCVRSCVQCSSACVQVHTIWCVNTTKADRLQTHTMQRSVDLGVWATY